MLRRTVSGISSTLLLTFMLMLRFNVQIPLETVKATATVLKMNPSYAVIGQEGQPVPTNQPVTISIEVEGVSDLATWQVVIYSDNNTLYTQGSWMWLPPDHIFAGKSYGESPAVTGSDVYGNYIMKCVSLHGTEPTFNGSGVLCKINFTAVGTPGISHLNFTQPIGSIGGAFETYLLDFDLNYLPASAVEGTLEVNGRITTEYDIGITGIVPSKTIAGQGYNLPINITMMNYGAHTETFNITLYANTTSITSQTITLPSGNSTTITFTWNTSGFAKGNYTIWAYAEPIPGDTYTEDNTLIDGWVIATIPGDVNGDFKCDGKDISLIAKYFGALIGQPNYVPNADINDDGKIDGKDISISATNFGTHYP